MINLHCEDEQKVAQYRYKGRKVEIEMRKNIMKKMVAIVATAVMSVCAIMATPTEAKAATTTELYLETDADAEYSVGFWQTTSGIQIDAEVTADGWTYAFDKVEDGVYKIDLLLSETFSSAGMSISVNGVETYKCDPNWSGVAGAEAWTAFTGVLGTTDKIYIGLDTTNVTITVKNSEGGDTTVDETEAPKDETEAPKDETEAPKDETKAPTTGDNMITVAPTTASGSSSSSNSSNSSAVIIGVSLGVILVVVAVIVVIIVAASKKKTVVDDDDFEY